MNETIKLKSCPFCGGRDSVELIEAGGEEEFFFVICNLLKCGCGASSMKTDEGKEDAIEAWNTRS